MKQNTIISVIVIGLIIVIALVLGLNKKPKTSDKVIRIGAPLSLTGMASSDGESIKKGIDLAQKELAAKGITVEVLYQDDATNPKQTVSAIQYLLTQKVDAVIGPTWSFLGDAGVPVLEQNGITSIQPADTSEFVTSRGPNTFLISTKNAFAEKPLEDYLKASKAKKVAIIVNQGGWGESVALATKQAVEKVNGTIVITQMMPYGSEVGSLQTISRKVEQEKPDVIVTALDSDEGIIMMMKEMNKIERPISVISVTSGFERVYKNEGFSVASNISLYRLVPQTSEAFMSKFKAEYQEDAGSYADTGYDALMMIVNGLQSKDENETLSEYLKSHTYRGILKNYEFDEKGDVKEGSWYLKKLN